ncbi:MAG: PIN domain-containing protein [Candidatus Helarchaeota archaeon]
MRIIIDTNIFIYREDNIVIPENLKNLIKRLRESENKILLHPLSRNEIKKDKNKKRREIVLSKIDTYPLIDDPPNPKKDSKFRMLIGKPKNENDVIDNNILYSIYKNAADFLITEDKGIHKKADLLGISQRVFAIDEALEYFSKIFLEIKISALPALKEVPTHNLNLEDPIFDSLKQDYPDFEEWWEKISREGRKAWVYYKNNRELGAILIYKIENEAVPKVNPIIPPKRRLKISTLKVSYRGYKIGELFLKMSFEYAIGNNLSEVYLTHFTKDDDDLVYLIEDFGFNKVGETNGEDIFFKKLTPDEKIEDPLQIARRFYPSFYDGNRIKKFIIPIWPEYHKKLFTDYHPRQTLIREWTGELIIEGNTIKKAYLSHSLSRKISPGDLVLFYRSRDLKSLTTLGVVEEVYDGLDDAAEIIRYVGKRTVYTREEIEQFAKRTTKVIIFRFHFHLKAISHEDLIKKGIIKQIPQSISEITHENYLKIKKLGLGLSKNKFTIS